MAQRLALQLLFIKKVGRAGLKRPEAVFFKKKGDLGLLGRKNCDRLSEGGRICGYTLWVRSEVEGCTIYFCVGERR